MEKEFIPYEQALALKELGFDEPCFSYYKNDQLSDILEEVINSKMRNVNNEIDDYISAPLYQQAFGWFREKYYLNSFIVDSKSYAWYFNINDMQTDDVISEVLYFKKYEEAELECLKKLIEIIKS